MEIGTALACTKDRPDSLLRAVRSLLQRARNRAIAGQSVSRSQLGAWCPHRPSSSSTSPRAR